MDTIDEAQRRQQEEIEQALSARRPAKAGRECCANQDCGEPIAPFRQQLGAQLCLDCQRAAEREAQSWARKAV